MPSRSLYDHACGGRHRFRVGNSLHGMANMVDLLEERNDVLVPSEEVLRDKCRLFRAALARKRATQEYISCLENSILMDLRAMDMPTGKWMELADGTRVRALPGRSPRLGPATRKKIRATHPTALLGPYNQPERVVLE